MGEYSELLVCPKCKKEYLFVVGMPMEVCPDCYRKLPDYLERVRNNHLRVRGAQ